MKNSWSNIEERFLSKEEIEWIRYTIVRADINNPKTIEWMRWSSVLAKTVRLGNATQEQINQYNRIMEIEDFIDIICEKFPKDMNGLMEYEKIAGKRKADLAIKISVEETCFDVEDAAERLKSEKIMKEEYGQDIEEPFIKDMIARYLSDVKESEKYSRLEKVVKVAGFKNIDDQTILSIAFLILKEIEYGRNSNLRISEDMIFLDKKKLAYLVLKNLKTIPLTIEEEPKNIVAKGCPADALRECIEEIIAKQREYILQGKEVPKELLIPQEIVLSPKNIEFLINSKSVDSIGAGETGNEIQFYWKKTDELPALELKVKRREDGKFVLVYIKEEASKEKEEFIWDKKTKEGRNGTIVVSKDEDALEDICDMDR